MKDIDRLKKEFEEFPIDFGEEILDNLSTKRDNGVVFPPYIPFIGKEYEKFNILVYSTAQNIKDDWFRKLYQTHFDKLIDRLYYFDKFKKHYNQNNMSYTDIDINPYKTGVLPALIGVFIYSKFNIRIENLEKLNDFISISNYYKFSLHNSTEDINPESKIQRLIKNKKQIENYWSTNDKLVKKEIDFLNPKYIISFNGRKLNLLNRNKSSNCQIIKINDPAWILRGGGGVFKKNNSWWRKAEYCKNEDVRNLIDNYLTFLKVPYTGRLKDNVRIYLLKYYTDWERQTQGNKMYNS